MKKLIAFLALVVFSSSFAALGAEKKIKVVTTLSAYAAIARQIGGERVEVDFLVAPDQDPHFVRPRPSLARKLASAELLVSTGLDLELWLPALVDISGNPEIRSGQRRFVSASAGVKLLEVSTSLSRSQGDIHIWGNPHFIFSPLAARQTARNIAAGLSNIDPEGAEYYRQNLESFLKELDLRLYGKELVEILGHQALENLAKEPAVLWEFLENKNFRGKPLSEYLGGWLGQAKAFRKEKAVSYHRLWSYFSELFGPQFIGELEPRPGIPPSPRHLQEIIERMRAENVRVIVSASYYDLSRVRQVEKTLGARAVIVPGGPSASESYFDWMEKIIEEMSKAFSRDNEN